MGADAKSGGHGDRQGPSQRGVELTLLEELRQPLTAASNYIGAARLLIAPLGNELCKTALAHLTEAEKQLLRAGGIIGKIRTGSKATNGSRLT